VSYSHGNKLEAQIKKSQAFSFFYLFLSVGHMANSSQVFSVMIKV